MRLAISNIAWDISEDESIAKLLIRHGIDAIDIAPGKYFPHPSEASDNEIAKIKNWWASQGIEITGMQSLLFGSTGLNVFGPEAVKLAMLERLSAICRIGGKLGANRLVFGSPKNRDRSALNDQETMDVAINFFRQLGNIAQSHNVIICLEPNPTHYGANFMTSSPETATVVENINHPNIRMQLDTGALTMNSESIESVLYRAAHLVGHIHISEPNLVPPGDLQTDHGKIHQALKRYLPNHVASIEMVTTRDEPHLVSIERALIAITQNYGFPGELSP